MKAPDPDTLKLVKDLSRSVITFSLARMPKTDRVFLAGSDFAIAEADLNAAKFEPKDLYKHESFATSVVLAGNTLISGGYDGKLIWWDLEKKANVRTLDAHGKWIRRVAVSPDGQQVASISDDMTCKLWDTASGKMIHELRGHELKTPQHFPSMLQALCFSTDGKYVATGDKVGHIVVWNAQTGKSAATLEVPVMYTWDKTQRIHSIGGLRSLAFSPDGSQLAAGGIGQIGNIDHLDGKARVEIFDWQAGKRTVEFAGDKFNGLVNKLVWAADSSWLLGAGGSGEGFFIYYDVAAKKIVKQEKAPMHIHDLHVTGNFEQLVAVGHNKITTYKMG